MPDTFWPLRWSWLTGYNLVRPGYYRSIEDMRFASAMEKLNHKMRMARWGLQDLTYAFEQGANAMRDLVAALASISPSDDKLSAGNIP